MAPIKRGDGHGVFRLFLGNTALVNSEYDLFTPNLLIELGAAVKRP